MLKKLIILFIIVFFIIFVMQITKDNRINYLSLGDSLAQGYGPYKAITTGYSNNIKNYFENENILKKYNNQYVNDNMRIEDLTNQIRNNTKVTFEGKKLTIQHALIKADITTISVGMNNLNNIITEENINESKSYFYKNIDLIINEYKELFKTIRIYCKEPIFIIGFYNRYSNSKEEYAKFYDPIYRYLNNELYEISTDYKITYIDIYEKFRTEEEYLPNPMYRYPSDKAYKVISDQIITNFSK